MLPNRHVFRSIECEVFHEYAAQTLIHVFHVLRKLGALSCASGYGHALKNLFRMGNQL